MMCFRAQSLEKELYSVHSKEREETSSLEKAIEQVEDNLKRTTVSICYNSSSIM